MGFDIECIVDIHTYPGEYFCPVCRTLVYPSEAVQSQCTHLYCKQCLLHVANGTRACPYDGYLVTEADSKPLVESDKVLAENIGKVKVHCLFFRSGCTWEGALSECDAHCSVCSFGNSPVICNRCSVQIVHRQVHEHAQSCPGAYEAHQAVAAVAGSSTAPSTTSVETNQVAVQAPNSQVVAATQVSASSQPAPVSGATAGHWYQQQYQQYYQQYPAYQSYPTQPYYQVQQQVYQQYPQQPVPVQFQSQPAVNSQSTAAPQPQLQTQPQIISQVPQQPQLQTQTQLISQVPQQPHLQPQGQGQPLPQQAMPSHAQNFYPASQPLPHPPMRPQAQIPPQSAAPPALVQAASHPQAMGIRAAGKNTQMPHYQQHQAPQVHIQHYGNNPGFARTNGGPRPEISMPDLRGEKRKNFAMESMNPFPSGQTQPLNQSLGTVPVQGQSQPAVNSQSTPAPQPQPQLISKAPQQSHLQPQTQGQGQPLPQQVMPSHGQNYPGNQPPPHPPVQPLAQIPQSAQPPTLVQAGSHPHPMGIRAAGQNTQLPQYQQHQAPQAHIQPYGNEPGFARANGGPRPEYSVFDSRGKKRKSLDPLPLGQTQLLNQSLEYDAASKLNSGGPGPQSRYVPPDGPSRVGSFGPGPEFGQHHMKQFGPRSPDRVHFGISPRGHGGPSIFPRGNVFPDVNGREANRFGGGPRPFNPSSDLGNPFHDGRFPPLAGDLRRGNIDDPGNLRFGDHMAPRLLHNHNRRPEFQDGPGLSMRIDAGPGYFSGNFNTSETAGPGGFSVRARMAEFGTGSFPGMRNSFPVQGPPNASHFAGGMDSFDMSRKRPSNAGWCRICKIDCETVEGLDMHSQTREHQKMSMDMVKMIKQQNKKPHRPPYGDHISHDGGRSRKVGPMYHANKQ